jgi:hypothetical protein
MAVWPLIARPYPSGPFVILMIIVVEFAMPFCTQNFNYEIAHLYFTRRIWLWCYKKSYTILAEMELESLMGKSQGSKQICW